LLVFSAICSSSAAVKGCSPPRLPCRVASALMRLLVFSAATSSSAAMLMPANGLPRRYINRRTPPSSHIPPPLSSSKPPPLRPPAPLAAMDHQHQERVGAAANGFGRRPLHVTEARALWDARYSVPLDKRCSGARRSAAAVCRSPLCRRGPTGPSPSTTIFGTTSQRTSRTYPQWSPCNDDAWTVFFVRQHADRLA
jgi:hypothetical protein